jgi:hypothetical protein
MLTKSAHDDLTVKIAQVDRVDTQNAFELGFIKQAQFLGLNQAQIKAAYDHGVAVLTKKG